MDIDLAAIEARYEELNRKLLQTETLNDPKQLRDIAREQQRLSQILHQGEKIKKCREALASNAVFLQEEIDLELACLAKEERACLLAEESELSEQLKVLLLPVDERDTKNIILEIRSGTGGDEAALFCGEMFRMYSRFAESMSFRVEVLSLSYGSVGGFKEVIASIEGEFAYRYFKFESGVHRVQRVPATETQGRIHTSAVTVAVLPEAEDIEVSIQEKELKIDVYRSSGPGGQSVNTTDSAVRITHIPTGLVVTCQDEKSQHKNKAKGLKILKARLLDKMQAEQAEKVSSQRRDMVKSGDRSEKIRTYNFPQDRLTDHRINLTLHHLPGILQGDLKPIVDALLLQHQTSLLAEGTAFDGR
jgi:peptide chain release factor 1